MDEIKRAKAERQAERKFVLDILDRVCPKQPDLTKLLTNVLIQEYLKNTAPDAEDYVTGLATGYATAQGRKDLAEMFEEILRDDSDAEDDLEAAWSKLVDKVGVH